MKHKRTPRILGCALFLLCVGVSAQGAAAECSQKDVYLRGDWGEARFSVEVADSAPERRVGLMNRTELAKSAGMLFVYHQTRPLSFWMKNTLIPLDIIYFDEAGRLVNVHVNAVPLDLTSLPSAGPARYVLEINGGLASAMGIDASTELRHPAVLQHLAAWPCHSDETPVSE